ncbi:MAG: twin-arginine translocase TatA/TatE family subunit [Atopobiaceae bacterium]|nr:twin-arginine translocase TatA/TatE family subunit [Atopobiaceae bacterium]
MFGIGETELVIILLFAFMLFGPDKLPGMGRTIGRALRQFREAQEGFTKVVQTEIVDPINKAADDPEALVRRRKAMSQDADIDDETTSDNPASDADASGAAPEKKESFAERRARLKAEAEAAKQDAESNEASSQSTPSDAASETSEQSSEQLRSDKPPAATENTPAVETPSPTSAAALYGLASPAQKASEEPTALSTDTREEAGAE